MKFDICNVYNKCNMDFSAFVCETSMHLLVEVPWP
jgi:hypothetical protein